MKAIAGLSKQQDRDLASVPVFCFVGEERFSVTAGPRPERGSTRAPRRPRFTSSEPLLVQPAFGTGGGSRLDVYIEPRAAA
jgi:hypothetical protein